MFKLFCYAGADYIIGKKLMLKNSIAWQFIEEKVVNHWCEVIESFRPCYFCHDYYLTGAPDNRFVQNVFRARAGFPKRTHRSPSPMASVHLRSHKREHEIISNDFTPLRMIERQRTPSIERLLKDTSGVVTMEKTPPRRRTGSPVRRNKNSRSSGSGNATGLSSSRIPSQGQGIQLDLDGDMSKVKRRTISRSKSPVRKSATSMSTSSRYQRRSKSKSTERHSVSGKSSLK